MGGTHMSRVQTQDRLEGAETGFDDEDVIGGAENAQAPMTPRISESEVIRRIQAECEAAGFTCFSKTARMVIAFFQQAYAAALNDDTGKGEVHVPYYGPGMYFVHQALDIIVPDDTTGAPAGSARAAIDEYIGTPARPAVSGHTKSDLYVEDDNCVVTVTTATVNLAAIVTHTG